MLHLLRQLTGIVLVLMVASSAHAELSRRDIARIIEQARKDSQKMTVPVNKHEKEGKEAAKRVADYYHSPEFQKRIEEQKQCIQEGFKRYQKPWQKQIEEAKPETGDFEPGEKIWLLLSSSMPDETVNTYIADLDRIKEPGIEMIMRGMPRGLANIRSMGKASWFARVFKKNLGCNDEGRREPCPRYEKVSVGMKPGVFTRYNITAVPAVIFEQGENSFVIQGDAGLDYLLEQINKEAKNKNLSRVIAKLRGKNG